MKSSPFRSLSVATSALSTKHPARAGSWLAASALVLAGLTVAGQASAQLQGQTQTRTTAGAAGPDIDFSVYLPPEYATSGGRRFPVVYHLHGITGAHDGSGQLIGVPESHEIAVALGFVEPVIIVFPDGYYDSFWADTAGGLLAESDVIDAIIPYVDSHFRTIPNPRHRIVQGFSMGAFGAAKFAAKFPDLFGAAVLYDGAFLTWPNLVIDHPSVAATHFAGSEAYFDEFSPYAQVAENASLLQATPFRQVAGKIIAANDRFRDHLLANDVPLSFISTYEDHFLQPVLDAPDPPGSSTTAADMSWEFIQSVFDGAPPTSSVEFAGVAAEDGWVQQARRADGTCGSLNAQGQSLLVGDTALRCQLRSVTSFDTSAIPDDATLLAASLRVARVGASGSTSQFGTLRGDVRRGAFGSSSALQSGDFQAAATAAGGIPSIAVPANGAWVTAALNAAGVAAVNRGTGRTQLRLGFATASDNDATADNVAFASANHTEKTLRPVLRVTFR